MSVATQATVLEPQQPTSDLQLEKFSDGPITCIKFSGVISERFEGKRVAATINAKKLVLDLGAVARVSSFGVREWLDFVSVLNRTVDEFYLINCSPKVMNQLNMVTDFTGKGRVFSFCAPYRCDYCETEHLVLLNCDRDHESIKKMQAPERACELCGNPETFDDEPITYLTFVANQPDFDLDPAIGNFLISKLGYAVSDLTRRMQAEKILEGRFIMMKLAGNLDGTFPAEKLSEGVEGVVVVEVSGVGGIDPAGAAEFRKFISFMKPHVEQVFLVGCEAMFLERTMQPEDLGGKVQVLSFALPFACERCQSTTTHMIDVEAHHDVLKIAMAPQQKCPECKGPTTCTPADTTRALMPHLPKPAPTPELKKFIRKARQRKPKKEEPQAGASVGRAAAVILPITLAVVGGMGALVYIQQQKSDDLVKRAVTKLDQARNTRPTWIASDIPFSAYCTDLQSRISCVGTSSYLASKEAAKIEASNAALEALANSIALRIESPEFRRHVLPLFRDARQLTLGDLDDARLNPNGPDFDRAIRSVRNTHRHVAAALRRTGGTAVPAQSSDWYWEEYERIDGEGTEFRAFVRFDITPSALNALVASYSTTQEVLGATVLTAFPSIAWRYPDAAVGALAVEIGSGPLKRYGVQPGSVFMVVGDQPVRDAEDFATRMKGEYDSRSERDGKVRFVIMTAEGKTVEFDG